MINTAPLNTVLLNAPATSANTQSPKIAAVQVGFHIGQIAQTASISDAQARTATLFYKLYITDGVTVDVLPMQSFQAEYRQYSTEQQGGESYLEVVLPGVEHADIIDAATRITVNKGLIQTDGTISEIELISGDIDSIRYDAGAVNSSTILTAREAFVNEAKRTRTLPLPFYQSTVDGRATWRGPVSFTLRPGDTASLHDGSTFPVDTISYLVGDAADEMTVTALPPDAQS